MLELEAQRADGVSKCCDCACAVGRIAGTWGTSAVGTWGTSAAGTWGASASASAVAGTTAAGTCVTTTTGLHKPAHSVTSSSWGLESRWTRT